MNQVLIILIILSLVIHSCYRPVSKPSVILLTLDTVRADFLGCYGHPMIKTPNLDRLAAEGALFEDAICQIPATLTSHTAIMTGRYPKTTGVRFRTAHVPEMEDTLAEIFSLNGYRTTAFISSRVLEPAFGLNQGFDRYDLGSMANQKKIHQTERRAEETIAQAIQYINDNKGQPFFVWIHLYDAHTPYDAPEPYGNLYDPDYRGPMTGTVEQITRLNASQGSGLNKSDREHLEALYAGEISYLDHQIGVLLQSLTENQMLDQVVIAALSDHGENLGERGEFFHGDTLYNTEIRIPFLLRYPPQVQPGMRVQSPVQTIDLYPTLLNLTQVDTPGKYVEGINLLPLLCPTQEKFEDQPGFMETEADVSTESNKIFGLRSQDYKLIYNQAHRRPETPLGLMTEIPLKGPSIILMRIKGDESIRVIAHIRYRTREHYTSRDPQALAQLNTTIIHAEAFGSVPIHRQAASQKSFLDTPPGWRLQATPDLYSLARDYGQSQGWPTEWMVIEGVGVDASLPYLQSQGTFVIDQFELYAPGLKFPQSPRFRDPFWVIEDFEGNPPKGLIDAKQGPAHTVQTSWENENLFGGQRQQKIEIQFMDSQNLAALDELYDMRKDPKEEMNLFSADSMVSNASHDLSNLADQMRTVLNHWLQQESGDGSVTELDQSQREALESLGYVK